MVCKIPNQFFSAKRIALYISLFLQLIAEPIVQYEDVERDIKSRETSYEKIYISIKRFMLDFGKKS